MAKLYEEVTTSSLEWAYDPSLLILSNMVTRAMCCKRDMQVWRCRHNKSHASVDMQTQQKQVLRLQKHKLKLEHIEM